MCLRTRYYTNSCVHCYGYIIKGFSNRVDEVEKAFLEQEKADEILAAKLDELQKNPEYIRKVKEASGDLDKLMDVLEEFSGIRMTWFELKQFGFRRLGVV